MVLDRMQYLMGTRPEAMFTDFYELEALGTCYIVSLATALYVERELDRWRAPVWIEFRDVFGARHRLPARCIYRITESTRATRAAVRAFQKAMRDEEREDGDPFASLD